MAIKVKQNGIYAFKMTSGQEIVGKIEDLDDDYYYIVAPLTIGQGQKGMEFLPAMFCAEFLADTAMVRTSVAMVSPAREDVVVAYKESVAPQSAIIGGKPKQIITG